jgi:hypothetical protein
MWCHQRTFPYEIKKVAERMLYYAIISSCTFMTVSGLPCHMADTYKLLLILLDSKETKKVLDLYCN